MTCTAPAYPAELLKAKDSGIAWIPAGDAVALADTIAFLVSAPARLTELGARSRTSYEKYFSAEAIRQQLRTALATLA